jgi:hypothetical protein
MQFKAGGSVKFNLRAAASGGPDPDAVHSPDVRNIYAVTREEYNALIENEEVEEDGLYIIVREE